MQHYLRLSLYTLGLIILQTTIIPFTSVGNIIPDLLLIWIVYIAVTRGQIPAAIFGFAVGLCLDFLSGQFIGLSALCKTVAGFLAGYFYHENKVDVTLSNYQFLVITGAVSLVHNILYFIIFTQGSDVPLAAAIFQFGVFSTLYTTAMALLPFFFYSRRLSLR